MGSSGVFRNQPFPLRLGVMIIILNLVALSFPGTTSPAAKSSRMYQRARDSYFKLEQSAQKQKYRHHWLNTIDLYRLIFETVPKAPEADDSLYMVGKLYRSLYHKSQVTSDLDMSVYYFRRLVKSFPDSRYADDAQYFIGEIFLDEKQEKAMAYREFEKVVDHYPHGDMYKKAAAMVSRLSSYKSKPQPAVVEPPPAAYVSGKLARATRVRHWSNPSYTRVVVDVDHPVKYNYNFLKQNPSVRRPPRLYIDLFNTRLSTDLARPIPISDGLLTSARVGQFTTDTVRVVLDMARISEYRIFALRDPFRIVIDISGDGREKIQVFKGEGGTPPAGSSHLSLAQQLGLDVRRVVIDPGHGGKDPGAVGVGGLKEKDVTLDVGLRLKRILQEDYGLEVIMTRERDTYLELTERTGIANANKADLFVSIHCNSSKRKNLKGVETYFLNIASSQEAAETAARENMTTLNRISDYESIMVDFMLTMKIDESSRFARIIQDEVYSELKKDYRDTIDLGVKQAPFLVLIGATMPSILAEISFINHPLEGKRLAQASYRQDIAEALAAGIGRYIKSVKLVSSK